MKIILVIQSLIILAAAAYIFVIRQESQSPVTPVVVEPVVAPATTTDQAETLAPVAEVEPVPQPNPGPNDAGMEWPTVDGAVEAR